MSDSSSPILLVDDTPAHRTLIIRAIRKAGFDSPIVELGSVSEARTALLQREPGSLSPLLGIIDLNLGDGRSTGLIRELRSSAAFRELPILVLSTSSLESDMQESYASGANCYITKAGDITIFTREIEAGVRFLLGLRST